LSNTESLKGKAKRKCITQRLSLHLIDIAKAKGNTKMTKQLWNTYHCHEKLITVNGKSHVNYCKNRLCTVCNSIRKADFINRYFPILKAMEDPYFVTLTLKAVSAKRLKPVIESMLTGFSKIIDKHRKQEERGTGNKFIGIRSLECNFNPIRRTYNPHFHLVVQNKETAEKLIKEWMAYAKPTWTYKGAQHYRPSNNNEALLIEIIKYGSKIFTEPNGKKGEKAPPNIYIKALYNILDAFSGHRLFASFGFTLPPQQKQASEPFLTSDYTEWKFNPFIHDWFSPETGDTLSGFTMPPELANLLENNINKELD
jgi:hypothetical protein